MTLRNQNARIGQRVALILPAVIAAFLICAAGGCSVGGIQGYTNDWLHPQDVSSVYVEMFDTRSFRRGHEYALTSAICKQIEARTPYKIISNRDTADTILSGEMTIGQGVLSSERYEGRPLEREVVIKVIFTWKNLKTGEILVNREQVMASGDFTDKLNQDFAYAADVAVHRAAERVVERMEQSW
ncbi:MAG: hypothetical protein GX455_02195 [Phycisphaerae bacterium]|nr:hypothetical protein [Phycisphaerae bacterium]